MSHSIISFEHSNLVTIVGNKFLIRQDEPVYNPSKFVLYNFKNKTQDYMDIPQPFAKFISDGKGIKTERDYEGFKKRDQTEILYKNKWGEIPIIPYTNLEQFPELNNFFEKVKGKSWFSATIYGNYDEDYSLGVWASRAYVVGNDNKITAYHIDESCALQEGDSSTFVWSFDDHFVVYNDGDVYSVVLVVNK